LILEIIKNSLQNYAIEQIQFPRHFGEERSRRTGIQVSEFLGISLFAPGKRIDAQWVLLLTDANRISADILLHHSPVLPLLPELEHHDEYPSM
jgi:hypothetical protein